MASIGLRPHTVYGVGRDQGLTSAPTKAMLHAAAGLPYHIGFGGSFQMQFGADVARAFLAAAGSDFRGSVVLNLPTPATDMASVVEAIELSRRIRRGRSPSNRHRSHFPPSPSRRTIEAVLGPLPETPLQAGVEMTIAISRDYWSGV